ncbi:G protein-coupled receptor gpr1 [Exophiala xenobiotica]|nr:G protein-coupled receptor gpr1 [Exophiala xenobiotica]
MSSSSFSPGDYPAAGASLSPDQNEAVHIATICCASISLLAALVTVRWFLVMKKTFRHILVMNLIISDSLKAVIYFLFPVVVFARGPVASSSKFCQATGFLLTFGVEAADMAILIIALHAVLYIVRPPNNALEQGGLYPYRWWVWAAWLLPPLVAACLAFIRNSAPYTTSGIFCSLPKRPIWYRLALSWVPRYIILAFIIITYLWIYIYVTVKFRGFNKLGEAESSSNSPTNSRRKSILTPDCEDIEQIGPDGPALGSSSWVPQQQPSVIEQPTAVPQQLEPWDYVNFITSKPLQDSGPETSSPNAVMPMQARGSGWSGDTQVPLGRASVKPSITDASGLDQSTKPETDARPNLLAPAKESFASEQADPMKKTRMAIRKQLRYLFIYPLVYIIVWTFPFIYQVQLYNSYGVQHPTFWLILMQAIMLSSQAGVDSVLFSWTEKPWRRIDPDSTFAIPALRRRGRAVFQKQTQVPNPLINVQTAVPEPTSPKRHTHWWEVEARRRKDSIWLGSSTLHASRTRSRSPEKARRLPTLSKQLNGDVPPPIPELESTSPRSTQRTRTRRTTLTPVSSNIGSREPGVSSSEGGRDATAQESLQKMDSNDPYSW